WVRTCAPDQRPVRPVIVAISGGASRAGIWGARILYDVEQASGPGKPAIFAVSSVSGGSLGAAAYMALLAPLKPEERCAGGVTPARQQQLQALNSPELAQDALGPLLAGALIVDVPRAIFSPLAQLAGYQPRGGDRAEALERAFEGLWRRSAK